MALEDEIDRFINTIDLEFRKQLDGLYQRIGAYLTEEQIMVMLERGDIPALVGAIPIAELTERSTSHAFDAAVLAASAFFLRAQPPPVEVSPLTITAPAVAAEIRATLSPVEQEIAREIELGLRGFALSGKPLNEEAKAFVRSVGLGSRFSMAAANYEAALRTGDASILLRRSLRDKRFDATLRRLARGDKSLSDERIERIARRYRERAIVFRRNAIAENLARRAFNVSQDQTLEQVGLSIARFWIHRGDHLVRQAHIQIPMLNPKGREPGQQFISPLGPIRYPHDPRATSENTLGCRCVIRVDYLDTL